MCRLCFNCQKLGHFAKDCRAPNRQAAPVNAVRMNNNPRVCHECGSPDHFRNTLSKDCRAPNRQAALVNAVRMNNNPRVCHECGSLDHFRNTCPKLNRAPGQTGNQLAIEGSRNNRSNGNQIRGRAYNVNVNAMEAVQDPNVCHGSFDVIIGMDRLFQHKAVIICHDKVVEIPVEDGRIFRLREFEDVISRGLISLLAKRQVEFRLGSSTGATPIAKSHIV
ncbi:reverse transcriptase domain-containing protein [Tanacetum coccineum]|uniref:Reverse transcriptase domain-containing protein n=1 Tax=Tanacetum coccineum TaxID=301880 RepID=A0ABQ5AQV0_9ASTR